MYIKLREELRVDELEVKDSYCRPEQEVYLAEEGIIDDFLNCWTSSNQQRDVMIKTLKKEEPSVFEADHLCMYAGSEQPLEDMFMQVAADTKDGQLLNTNMEVEDDESNKTWKKDGTLPEDKRKVLIAKGEVEKRYEDNLMTGASKSVCVVQTLEVMELSLEFLFKNYEPVLIING